MRCAVGVDRDAARQWHEVHEGGRKRIAIGPQAEPGFDPGLEQSAENGRIMRLAHDVEGVVHHDRVEIRQVLVRGPHPGAPFQLHLVRGPGCRHLGERQHQLRFRCRCRSSPVEDGKILLRLFDHLRRQLGLHLNASAFEIFDEGFCFHRRAHQHHGTGARRADAGHQQNSKCELAFHVPPPGAGSSSMKWAAVPSPGTLKFCRARTLTTSAPVSSCFSTLSVISS